MEFNFSGKTALVTGAGKGIYLRNEFNFWNVIGIMNTSGLLQIK